MADSEYTEDSDDSEVSVDRVWRERAKSGPLSLAPPSSGSNGGEKEGGVGNQMRSVSQQQHLHLQGPLRNHGVNGGQYMPQMLQMPSMNQMPQMSQVPQNPQITQMNQINQMSQMMPQMPRLSPTPQAPQAPQMPQYAQSSTYQNGVQGLKPPPPMLLAPPSFEAALVTSVLRLLRWRKRFLEPNAFWECIRDQVWPPHFPHEQIVVRYLQIRARFGLNALIRDPHMLGLLAQIRPPKVSSAMDDELRKLVMALETTLDAKKEKFDFLKGALEVLTKQNGPSTKKHKPDHLASTPKEAAECIGEMCLRLESYAEKDSNLRSFLVLAHNIKSYLEKTSLGPGPGPASVPVPVQAPGGLNGGSSSTDTSMSSPGPRRGSSKRPSSSTSISRRNSAVSKATQLPGFKPGNVFQKPPPQLQNTNSSFTAFTPAAFPIRRPSQGLVSPKTVPEDTDALIDALGDLGDDEFSSILPDMQDSSVGSPNWMMLASLSENPGNPQR